MSEHSIVIDPRTGSSLRANHVDSNGNEPRDGNAVAEIYSQESNRSGDYTTVRYVGVGSKSGISDRVLIGSFGWRNEDGLGRGTDDSFTVVRSREVSAAVSMAVKAALVGGLTPQENQALDQLRQDVARFGVNDGRYDEVETSQIIRRATQIAPNAVFDLTRF